MAWGFVIALGLCSAPMALLSTTTAAANTPAPGPASPTTRNECRGTGPKVARERADLLFRQAQYRQAAQCYLIAGKKPLADLAFIKATAAEAPSNKRQLTANANQVKEQLRQLREAFGSH